MVERWCVVTADGKYQEGTWPDEACAKASASATAPGSRILRLSDTNGLSVSALARAIFNTDRRVEEDVFKNGCEHTSKGSGEYFQRAWDKNINGWRSEAEARAAAILGVLGK